MKTSEIKKLVEAFYNGETTIEEEKLLLSYFQGEDVAEELLTASLLLTEKIISSL